MEEPYLDDLTEREFDVWSLLCNGDSNKSIAEKLTISGRTVQHYLNLIYQKLEITGDNRFNQRVRAALLYKERYPYDYNFRLDDDQLPPPIHNALSFVAQGYSNQMIAQSSRITTKTVGNYLNIGYWMLGIEDVDSKRVVAMLIYSRFHKNNQ